MEPISGSTKSLSAYPSDLHGLLKQATYSPGSLLETEGTKLYLSLPTNSKVLLVRLLKNYLFACLFNLFGGGQGEKNTVFSLLVLLSQTRC